MAGPLLETKLYAPPPHVRLVPRPRLADRLRRGVASRLTLVSAPAGFGKTTILGELAATIGAGQSVAWLSLDDGDNDPAVFWAYVVAALQRAGRGASSAIGPLIETGSSTDVLLATLINDLSALPGEIILILDDFHEIHSPAVVDSVGFLVEHAPANLHVVLGTRADPPLPLARLRARGALIEIRAADLRFSPGEAASYLNDTVGLGLAPHEVHALESRTEGWIAALQLAALSMEGRQDHGAFIAGFAGDDRYVVDYLVEEVLHQQTSEARAFLLQTSILSRVTGPLCDALTGLTTGTATLQALDRANLFLIPLDDRRAWYRYHHLFADMLRTRLLAERPGDVPALHERASDWYEAHGERSEAIRHAIAGGHVERAADLIERAVPEMHRLRQELTLRSWFEALPPELLRWRPVLAVGFVGALMSTGQFAGVQELLDGAERALANRSDIVVADAAGLERLPSAIARYRAARALAAGDLAETMRHAGQAVDRAVPGDHLGRGAGAALLGLAHWTRGNLEAAHESYAAGMASLARGDHVADVVGGSTTIADIRIAQGRLGDALRTYEQGLEIGTSGGGTLRGTADMHAGIAEVLYERNDLEGVRRHLAAGAALGEALGFPKFPWRSRVTAARLRRAEGDLDGALQLLEEAERRYVADFAPNVRPVAAVRARMLVEAGRLPEAWDWARAQDLPGTGELDYLHEYEHTVLASLLVAHGHDRDDRDSLRQASELLDRLLAAAEAGGRVASAIDLLLVRAQAMDAVGDRLAAVADVVRAVRLAEPEGFVRVFLDHGPRVVRLVRMAAKEAGSTPLPGAIVAAVDEGAAPARPGRRQPLVEPLSSRELEVLRLLQSDLDGPDIAAELSVSLNTLRTHTKNIYAKLGVTSRRAAVRRALELELIARS